MQWYCLLLFLPTDECEDHGRYAALAKKVHDRIWGCDYNWNMTGQYFLVNEFIVMVALSDSRQFAKVDD